MTGIVEGQIVRNTPQFSNAVSLVVEAIGKCMVGSSLEEQAIAALEACRYAELLRKLETLRCAIGKFERRMKTDGQIDTDYALIARALMEDLDKMNRPASQVRDSSQQSSDMVERVARTINRARLDRCVSAQAIAALETSHHAALVEALRTLATFDFGTRADMRKYAAKALAKIGGAA